MTFVLVALAAFIAAAINSVAGGGTFLTFPTLTDGLRLSEKVANMTSTIGLWPGSASGIYAARKDIRRIPYSIVVSYSVISLVGGIAGSIILRYYTSPATFRLVIPWLLLFATLVFAASKPIARWAGAKHGHRTLGWTVIVGVIQLVISLYGGYFGAGIGVLMLAGLSFAGLEDIHQMNALKVLLATLINGVAAVVFLVGSFGAGAENAVNWQVAGTMAGASIVGGFLGMGLARRIPPLVLRIIILLVGFGLTGMYFIRAYG
ncbi:sulfite exporter TauE/SafE family protein [Humisphaera borealis]|uniref:Probable membrane transporter protein n=1 Tax=Humisphaera borealis TaxID=2807512 RepID=A0A7M2WZR3_9BACT|nr:sulfite exporter TauE/SafE family protein [Humisphaera borealis]QOV90682.1 sulfite exporter TauE/SafE family protein [Humisphaera borealis]